MRPGHPRRRAGDCGRGRLCTAAARVAGTPPPLADVDRFGDDRSRLRQLLPNFRFAAAILAANPVGGATAAVGAGAGGLPAAGPRPSLARADMRVSTSVCLRGAAAAGGDAGSGRRCAKVPGVLAVAALPLADAAERGVGFADALFFVALARLAIPARTRSRGLVEASAGRRVEVAAGPAGPRRGVFVMGISRYAAPMRQNQGRGVGERGKAQPGCPVVLGIQRTQHAARSARRRRPALAFDNPASAARSAVSIGRRAVAIAAKIASSAAAARSRHSARDPSANGRLARAAGRSRVPAITLRPAEGPVRPLPAPPPPQPRNAPPAWSVERRPFRPF